MSISSTVLLELAATTDQHVLSCSDDLAEAMVSALQKRNPSFKNRL